MGLFKSREEKIAEQKEWKKRIANSPMIQVIQDILLEKYGSLDSKGVRELRRAGVSGCELKVEKDGFTFILKDRHGESIDGWGMSFDAMGYEELPNIGVEMFSKIMLDTLSSIPHLTVWETYIMYRDLMSNNLSYAYLDKDAYDMVASYAGEKEMFKIKEKHMKGGKVNMCQGLREWMEDERNAGLEEGKLAGKAEMLISSVESVMLKFNVDLGKACEGVGTTVEEYFKAKEKTE